MKKLIAFFLATFLYFKFQENLIILDINKKFILTELSIIMIFSGVSYILYKEKVDSFLKKGIYIILFGLI